MQSDVQHCSENNKIFRNRYFTGNCRMIIVKCQATFLGLQLQTWKLFLKKICTLRTNTLLVKTTFRSDIFLCFAVHWAPTQEILCHIHPLRSALTVTVYAFLFSKDIVLLPFPVFLNDVMNKLNIVLHLTEKSKNASKHLQVPTINTCPDFFLPYTLWPSEAVCIRIDITHVEKSALCLGKSWLPAPLISMELSSGFYGGKLSPWWDCSCSSNRARLSPQARQSQQTQTGWDRESDHFSEQHHLWCCFKVVKRLKDTKPAIFNIFLHFKTWQFPEDVQMSVCQL